MPSPARFVAWGACMQRAIAFVIRICRKVVYEIASWFIADSAYSPNRKKVKKKRNSKGKERGTADLDQSGRDGDPSRWLRYGCTTAWRMRNQICQSHQSVTVPQQLIYLNLIPLSRRSFQGFEGNRQKRHMSRWSMRQLFMMVQYNWTTFRLHA